MAGRNTATGHSSGQTYPQKAYRDCNQVAQEKIWSENVYKENAALKRCNLFHITVSPSGNTAYTYPSEFLIRFEVWAKLAQQWKKNWGFMTEYDYRGQPRPKRELPKEIKFYKEDVPTTTTSQYGLRLESPSSKRINQLERLTSFHKKKSGLEENYT